MKAIASSFLIVNSPWSFFRTLLSFFFSFGSMSHCASHYPTDKLDVVDNSTHALIITNVCSGNVRVACTRENDE